MSQHPSKHFVSLFCLIFATGGYTILWMPELRFREGWCLVKTHVVTCEAIRSPGRDSLANKHPHRYTSKLASGCMGHIELGTVLWDNQRPTPGASGHTQLTWVKQNHTWPQKDMPFVVPTCSFWRQTDETSCPHTPAFRRKYQCEA